MYLKHKKTGQYFVRSDALEATGNYEKVDSLPEAPEASAPDVPAKQAPKPRVPKGK